MDFSDLLLRYADVIVTHGANVQAGQLVHIGCEACHRDFAYIVAKAAYSKGAKYVGLDLIEPRLGKVRIECSTDEALEYVPPYVNHKYSEFVDQAAATIRILGSEDPDLLSELPPAKINRLRMANYRATQYYSEEGVKKSKVHWTLAAAATPGWAKKVFPEVNANEGTAKLWNEIFKICRIDKPDPIIEWKKHNAKLHARAVKLTELRLKELHFTGPSTDLKVGLSDRAIFKGGGDLGPRGVEFEPNIPTEECFTTPDARRTEGKVAATRPFLVNGKMIEGLNLQFKEGEIVNFTATSGRETFAEYIASDPGAKRLGEVALVGTDSPVFKSGLVFQEILFDENAACHIAIGSAYKFCLRDGDRLAKEELEAIGCNESSAHTDIMISSEEVDVTGLCHDGTTVHLIRRGAWQLD